MQFLTFWVALMKDEAYISSLSDIAEYSEPHLRPKPLKVASTREAIDLNQNNTDPQCLRPVGLNEGRGKRSVSFTDDPPLRGTFKPASKASFANLCRKLSTSLDDKLSDHDDEVLDDKLSESDDELDHGCEPSEIPPILSKGPVRSLGYDGKPRPAQLLGYDEKPCSRDLLGYDGKLRPAELLGYDGKPVPAQLLGHDEKTHFTDLLGYGGQLRSAKLLGYDGKPRPAQLLGDDEKFRSTDLPGPRRLFGPAELLGYDGKPRPPRLLGIDISDGKKSRPPVGTWAKAFKSKPRNSEKTDPDMTSATRSASGSFFGKKKDQENDVFGPSTSEQSLPSPASGVPRQPRFTRGSLQIEVIASFDDSSFVPELTINHR